MPQGIAVKERTRRTTRSCQHRWVIETPHGATSRGLCKRCGASKRFPNAAEDVMSNPTGGLGRWSGRRDMIRPKEIAPEESESEA